MLQLTSVNKPREFDILTNRFKQHHETRSRFEADELRKAVVTNVLPPRMSAAQPAMMLSG